MLPLGDVIAKFVLRRAATLSSHSTRVRKRLVEIQYLGTTITDEQRNEFAQLVQDTIRQIESARFLPHSGIRFPQNPSMSCPYVGLCLGKPQLVEAVLIRRPGAEDFGVFDELTY